MKIETRRTHPDDEALSFNLLVKDPFEVPFEEEGIAMMAFIDKFLISLEETFPEETEFKSLLIKHIDSVKKRAFHTVIARIKESISASFQPQMEYVYQEVYNWIYDHQTEDIKRWMDETGPQRVKFYFDNDVVATTNNHLHPQESEYDDEDFDEDEEEDE